MGAVVKAEIKQDVIVKTTTAIGVPPGGTIGQVLKKLTDEDYSTEWANEGGGSGEANTASNVGLGSDLFKQKVGVDLEFRTLTAGSNIGLTQNVDDVEIAFTGSLGEINTGSNLGTGEGIFSSKVGVDLQFKSLKAGTNITLTPSGTEIEIAAAGGGGQR